MAPNETERAARFTCWSAGAVESSCSRSHERRASARQAGASKSAYNCLCRLQDFPQPRALASTHIGRALWPNCRPPSLSSNQRQRGSPESRQEIAIPGAHGRLTANRRLIWRHDGRIICDVDEETVGVIRSKRLMKRGCGLFEIRSQCRHVVSRSQRRKRAYQERCQ
jgi:hypothetical protein